LASAGATEAGAVVWLFDYYNGLWFSIHPLLYEAKIASIFMKA
jgi:hypothetical protein